MEALEGGSEPGTITIKEGDVVVASGITVVDFLSGFSVNQSPTGEVNISVTASGGHAPVTVQDTGTIDLTLVGQEISAIVKPSGISLNGLGDVDTTGVQNNDVLGYSNGTWIPTIVSGGIGHNPVSLAGSYDYITLSGQQITLNQIDLATDVTGILPDGNVANDITLDNITQITNRSHTNLSDIGTNTHTQIDSHITDTSIHFDELDELSDVVVTTAVSGQYLKFLGTNWVGATVSGGGGATVLNGLTDVDIVTPASGEVLTWIGNKWINAVVSGSSGGHIISYYGIDQTQRDTMNFTGGVYVSDDTTHSETDVEIHKHVFNENLSSQITVSGTTIVTTSGYVEPGTLALYYQGLRKLPTDYTVANGNEITTTFGMNPSDELMTDYVILTGWTQALTITYRDGGFHTESTQTTSPTLDVPASIQDGDLIILTAVTNVATTFASSVSGFTLIDTQNVAGSDATLALYYKIASSEGVTWTFTDMWTTSTYAQVSCVAYYNFDAYDPIDSYLTGAVGPTVQPGGPEITPSVNDCMIIQICGSDPPASNYSGTADSTYGATERIDGIATTYAYTYIQEYRQAVAAPITLTPTITGSDYYGVAQIVIKPGVA